MNHDVFISFSFQDQRQAESIVNILSSQYGISCWICTRDLDGGDQYKELIPEAIDTAKVVVFLQSSSAVESKEIPKEIGMAFDEEKTIIPFKLDDAKLKGKLRYDLYGIEFIDATKPTFEERIADLAKSIKKVLNLVESKSDEIKDALASSNISCSEIFYGRDDVLCDIHNAYKEGRNTVFLRGMGGIGKSEIAKQYARKYRDEYNTVVFARYESSIAAVISDDSVFSVRGISRKIKANNETQTDEEYAKEKLNIIKKLTDEKTLIIIDNFDVTIDPLLEDLTTGGSYRVLVTTRCQPERGKYLVIPVGEIDDESLKDMVIDFANPENTMIDRDDEAFGELLDITQRHTLTLELIAKHMDEKCIDDISEMVYILKKNNLAALSDSCNRDGFEAIRNIFRLTELSEDEKAFLRYLAMMPPSGVDQKLFRKWCGEVFSVRSRLCCLSLIRVDAAAKKLALHPIVREVVIAELKPDYENCREFVEVCAMVGQDAISLMWSLNGKDKLIYKECYAEISGFIKLSDETFEAYVNMSCMYNFIADYSEAIEFQNKIYEFACEKYGAESDEAMLALHRIAWKNSNCNIYDKAIEIEEKTVSYFCKHPNYDLRESLQCISALAASICRKYQSSGKKEYETKALELLKAYHDYGLIMVQKSTDEQYKNSLIRQIKGIVRYYVLLHMQSEQYDLAEKYLQEYKEAVEDNDTDMTGWYFYCGQLKYKMVKYDEALSAYLKSYEFYMTYFLNNNARIINTLKGISECYDKKGMPSEASKYAKLALEAAEGIYSSDHPILKELREKAATCSAHDIS